MPTLKAEVRSARKGTGEADEVHGGGGEALGAGYDGEPGGEEDPGLD